MIFALRALASIDDRRKLEIADERAKMPRSGEQVARLTRNLTAIVSGDDDVWFDTAPGESMRVRVHARDVDGRFSVVECLAEPMSGTPRHRQRVDEIVLLLEGSLTFEIEDRRVEAGVGDIIVIPAGRPHAWRNFGCISARSIVTFAPGGLERMYTTIKDVPSDRVREYVAHHGLVLEGPMIDR